MAPSAPLPVGIATDFDPQTASTVKTVLKGKILVVYYFCSFATIAVKVVTCPLSSAVRSGQAVTLKPGEYGLILKLSQA